MLFRLLHKMLLIILLFSFYLFSCSSCDIAVLSRTLEKTGFHREIRTALEMPADDVVNGMAGSEFEQNCKVLFKEVIPSSAYVDPFQLAALKDFGGPDYLLTDHVNVESPEYESSSFVVYIFANVTHEGKSAKASYSLPVHLRYHAVTDRDYTLVTIDSPEIAMRCRDKDQGKRRISVKSITAPCDSTGLALCEWTGIQVQQKYADLQMTIPVGRTSHYLLVTIGTVITTLLGCIFLGYNTVSRNMKSKIS